MALAKIFYRIDILSIRNLAITLFLLSFFLILPQTTQAQIACPQRAIDQITDVFVGNNEDPAINADGRYVTFESDVDFNDNNPNGKDQVYLFDTFDQVLTQITNDPDEISFDPKIDDQAKYIAFNSDADFNGGNPNNKRQVYVFDITNQEFIQITDDPDDGSTAVDISGNGMYVAFESDADHTGNNGDFNDEIFLANVHTGVITQITDDPAERSEQPSISGNGNIISFDSNADFNGTNPLNIENIFFANVSEGTITQVSFADTFARRSNVNPDGTHVAYDSSQNINGGNPDGNAEIFLYEIATGQTTQVTFTTDGFNQFPSLNKDATLLAFESASDFNGSNPDLIREIWLYDVVNDVIIQVTDLPTGTNSSSNHPVISSDGSSIAFDSRSDINGGNPELNREVYVARCSDKDDIAVPTLSEWGLIAMAGVLGIVGFMVARRRKVISNI